MTEDLHQLQLYTLYLCKLFWTQPYTLSGDVLYIDGVFFVE